MGSPLAPMLYNATIPQVERQWNAIPKPIIHDTIIVRYVDNLLSITSDPSFKPFPADFYGAPIELEDCKEPDNFLGLRLSSINGNIQCSFITRPAAWRDIHSCAAGTITRKLQGLQTRLSLAKQLSFTFHLATRSMVQLVRIYIQLGYTKLELQDTIDRFRLTPYFLKTWCSFDSSQFEAEKVSRSRDNEIDVRQDSS